MVKGHEIIRDETTNAVVQFVSAATVAAVEHDAGGNGYTLKFYHRNADTPREGEADPPAPYVTEGEPFVSVRIESPDGAPKDGDLMKEPSRHPLNK